MAEVRLIDANKLPVHKEYCVDEAGWCATFYVVSKEDIDNAPTVDAVEVVRCGKCCHFLNRANIDEDYAPVFSDGIFGITGGHKEADNFCSCGKRREENERRTL